MRIFFKKGKEKELIKREREKLKLSLPKLAEHLKIKLGKLQPYYNESSSMPEEIFNKFVLKKQFAKWIIEKKDDNWGRRKGGFISKGNTKEIKFPKESEKLAEFYGIMFGDGNLNVKKGHKLGTYQIRIVGDSRHDC